MNAATIPTAKRHWHRNRHRRSDPFTQSVNVGITPDAVAVNPVTNKIYVANHNDGGCECCSTVTVIDGATNNTTTVNVEVAPHGVAVNSVTNKIYVTKPAGTMP